MAHEVRELRWEDFGPLTESYLLAYDEREAGRPIGITLFAERPSMSREVEWFSRLYRAHLEGTAVAFVATVDGRAVGLCTVDARGPPGSEEGGVGNLGILVHRDFRGRGLGLGLLRRTIEACRGRFELVRLSVFSINQDAIRLYRRLGFQTYGALPGALRRGEERLDVEFMYLRLTGLDTAPETSLR